MSTECKLSVHIKKAEYKDISGIISITSQAFMRYQKQCGALKLDALEETAEDVMYDIKNKLVLTAVCDDEIIGCVRVELFDDNSAYLTRFAVKTDVQNKGIGRLLMNAVDEAMQDSKVEILRLHTGYEIDSLVNFYKSLGFEVQSTENSRGYVRALLSKRY